MQIIYQTCGILRQLYSHHAEENNSLHSYRLKKQSNLIVNHAVLTLKQSNLIVNNS